MNRPKSGSLKHSLAIQSYTQTVDEYGGETEPTWSTDAVRRCSMNQIKATESVEGAGETVRKIFEIVFRYEAGLFAENKRLLDTRTSPNRVFDIQEIDNTNNEDKQIVIIAVERKWPLRG